MKRLIWLLLVLTLVSCAPAGDVTPTVIATPPSFTPRPTSPNTRTMQPSQITTATVFPSKILLANAPANCYLEVSPNIEWMEFYCNPGKTLKVGKVGEEAQMVTLFEGGVRNSFFSPDSKKLLVLARDPIKSHDAFWLYDVGNWQVPKKLLSVSSDGAATWYKATWSPDSKAIALNYFEEGYTLSILYLDGRVKNLLTYEDVRTPNVGHQRGGFGPAWSPDSKKIAYVSDDLNDDLLDFQPVQIHIVDVATGKKELVFSGNSGENGYNPMWSPDGSMIAFGPFVEESHPIYVYNIKEKTFTAFGDFYFHYTMSWSPNSKYLAVCNAPRGFYVISVATGQIVNLNENYCSSVRGWKGNDNIIVSLQGQAIYIIPFQR